jgi:predicted DNA-binding transcriptional regulator YafY
VPRPTARVFALLEILQNGGTRTVPDLAQRLEVDERTVRRYVTHLIDLGIPVESVRGRYGGYRLSPGYRLPPLMLTDDEAVAVLVGLVTGPWTGTAGSRLAAQSAAAKVRRVLPRPLAARLAALLDVADFTARPPVQASPEVDVLLLAAEAARGRHPVEIVHTSRDGRTTERTVLPYGVVAHAGRWYLTGTDAQSGDLRTFRLDRVVSARSQTFEVPAGFDPRVEVLRTLARTPWRHAVSVRVRASVEAVQARLPLGLATVAPVADQVGWVRVEIRAEQLDWLPGVLAGLDADLVVEGPDELRDLVRALGQRLLAAADGS